MSDGGSRSGESGFDWGLRPSGASEEPTEPAALEPAEPEPAAPEPAAPAPDPDPDSAESDPGVATQLMAQVEPASDAVVPATEIFAAHVPPSAADATPPRGEPGSAIDALFGETQFRAYEPGALDPHESPFAARSAPLSGPSGEVAESPKPSRAQKVLLSVAAGLVAVLALIALFFLGTRLPMLLGPAPAVSISTPSATPSPTPTGKQVGPIANGVHPWTALLGGECLDPYTNPWAERFTVVDCGKSHPAQMVFRGTFDTETDPNYPGATKLQAQISLLCAAPGVINLAAAGAYSDAQLQASYAVTAAEWADGEHDYFCFVNRASGQPLTGSVAVLPQAPATPAP